MQPLFRAAYFALFLDRVLAIFSNCRACFSYSSKCIAITPPSRKDCENTIYGRRRISRVTGHLSFEFARYPKDNSGGSAQAAASTFVFRF
jgi:hypothetical protein